MLCQQEYRSFPDIADALSRASKSGRGRGIPDAVLIDRNDNSPVAVIETKGSMSDGAKAVREAQGYGNALAEGGWNPLAIGLAGTDDSKFRLKVTKKTEVSWRPITYDNKPIGWVPTRVDLLKLADPFSGTEIRPSIPPLEVLARRADKINRLLREAQIKDEYRPSVVAATMLALWRSRGRIRRSPSYILKDINSSCRDAYIGAGKLDLAESIRVDEANDKLAQKARRIATILELLNITVLTAEHDYLGQLYETFFRYTGGNTIGQYFTPRHISRLMADVCEVTRKDIILDPACGTGGFLISCMDRILTTDNISRKKMVSIVKKQLIGFEAEPITAALCVANMMLRGDGTSGVRRGDCFTSVDYPDGQATVGLMNPPFPHKQTDTPVEKFIGQALHGLRHKGKLAVIVPMSLLVKRAKRRWRAEIMEENTLLAVCNLPDELFQPFAAATTAFIVLERGVPHDPQKKTAFVRLVNDGLSLKKGARVPSEPDEIPQAKDAIINHSEKRGFSTTKAICEDDEWAPGAHITSSAPPADDLKESIDVLSRRLASFYARYAKEIVSQRRAIEDGDLEVHQYRDLLTATRLKNAARLPATAGTLGGMFDIYYGMKELHSREGLPAGDSLIVSPTEEYNGCYGWHSFPTLIDAPFVTVAQTGSIGEAFVQTEPCAVNDDCLILLGKDGQAYSLGELAIVAACIRSERWRFTYGRKLTPTRICSFEVPLGSEIREWANQKISETMRVTEACLEPYQAPID